MKVVRQRKFINRDESTVNKWLSKIPAEDIVSISFHVYGFENASDEWTVVFYKVDIETTAIHSSEGTEAV